eukprot:CAMPEP_0116133518 /NCGR_PEP_ID=MMETSP0329-20121206/10150_1 /TAXON_ID=697910 /ORGANISM="Pseudo-nitzschia arenysensis, Strain B593" /LENGTH=242 /DNA_ID=CAMNT_0003628157 /DNA_START=136 /DNA_END=864 /DNA_ORIENTATION=+
MSPSQILVLLFATNLAFRQYSNNDKCSSSSFSVTAFTSSLPLSSHTWTRISHASLGSAAKEDENSEHFLLLDESVLLYSRLKTESTDDDVESQRKGEELTALIEDVVFDGSGIVRENGAAVESKESKNTSSEKEPSSEEPSSLDEISRALDEQILLGSQNTFSEEELQAWMAKIDSLREKLQAQLIALPPSSSTTSTSSTTTTANSKTSSSSSSSQEGPGIDRLRTRLESMRTSMEPTVPSR